MSDPTNGQPGGPVIGPDEKVCPYCAEVIKAAAIKCRYCQSDLPEEDAPAAAPVRPAAPPAATVRERAGSATGSATEPADELEDEPAGEPAPATATMPSKDAIGSERGLDRVALALGGLCLALAGLFVVLVLVFRPEGLEVADGGQVTDEAYRSAAMSAASADAERALSYSYKTLDADQEAARAVMTGDFAEEYDDGIEQVRDKVVSGKLTQQATVLTSSLISITEDRAEALLFVNLLTTAADSEQQQLQPNRVKLTLERQDGDWVVSKMTPF